MRLELQATLVAYDDGGRVERTLRRAIDNPAHVPRTCDRVIANENWEPVAVLDVVWDETLGNAVVELDAIDAEEVGPGDVARELLVAAGWHVVDNDSQPAPTSA
jgi:hypothetical protein